MAPSRATPVQCRARAMPGDAGTGNSRPLAPIPVPWLPGMGQEGPRAAAGWPGRWPAGPRAMGTLDASPGPALWRRDSDRLGHSTVNEPRTLLQIPQNQ